MQLINVSDVDIFLIQHNTYYIIPEYYYIVRLKITLQLVCKIILEDALDSNTVTVQAPDTRSLQCGATIGFCWFMTTRTRV